MRFSKTTAFILVVFAFLNLSCNVNEMRAESDVRFADQHFKTAIALIELHNIRFGEYPDSIGGIKFPGDWDKIGWKSVNYQKLDSGYVLDLTDERFTSSKSLQYPESFWHGLGLKRSNLKK